MIVYGHSLSDSLMKSAGLREQVFRPLVNNIKYIWKNRKAAQEALKAPIRKETEQALKQGLPGARSVSFFRHPLQWSGRFGRRQAAGFGAKSQAYTLGAEERSIPEMLREYRARPLHTLNQNAKHLYKSPFALGMLGLSAYSDKENFKNKQIRGETIGRQVGNVLGWAVIPGMPVVPQLLLWGGAEGLGARIGRRFNKPARAPDKAMGVG
jgi:hypothetical protein